MNYSTIRVKFNRCFRSSLCNPALYRIFQNWWWDAPSTESIRKQTILFLESGMKNVLKRFPNNFKVMYELPLVAALGIFIWCYMKARFIFIVLDSLSWKSLECIEDWSDRVYLKIIRWMFNEYVKINLHAKTMHSIPIWIHFGEQCTGKCLESLFAVTHQLKILH